MIIQEGQSDGLLLPISHSCLALDVSRSGYYEWLKRSAKIPAENSNLISDDVPPRTPSSRRVLSPP
jgi:hypothetical protein